MVQKLAEKGIVGDMKCKWYSVCPLRNFERRGIIGDEWNRTYCTGRYRDCRRYQQEEAGIPHPDILMPDGSFLSKAGK